MVIFWFRVLDLELKSGGEMKNLLDSPAQDRNESFVLPVIIIKHQCICDTFNRFSCSD
jgi:hypothetical protein